METFLIIMGGIVVCSLFFTVGFVAGRGQIVITRRMTKAEQEQYDKDMKQFKEMYEDMNAVYNAVENFGVGEANGIY